MAARPRNASAPGVPAFSKRRSTSVSTRDTKNEATLAVPDKSVAPPSSRRSKPWIYASITASYRSMLKMSVTLMLRPSAIISSMAGTPAAVAGIFTIRLARCRVVCRWRAAAEVALVLSASSGDTSNETYPSTPALAVWTGARMAQAAVTSWLTRAQ